MIPKILNFLLAPTPEDLNFFERKEIQTLKSTQLSKTLKWEPQAVQVIKEKIVHYKQTGNVRKLAIYESKLKGKKIILGKLHKLLKT